MRLVGLTTPVQEAVLASVTAARISAIEFTDGSTVDNGVVVVSLDDAVQVERVDIARADAESGLKVALAKAEWNRAKRELERLRNLLGDDFASSKELSDAVSIEEIKRIEFKLAQFQLEQAGRMYERERRVLEEYRLRSPFAGYIVEHLKAPGETVGPLEGIVHLVQLNPLHVVLDCPVALAPAIRQGQLARVRPTDDHWPARDGVVKLVSGVVDAASQTFKVKIEVDNQDLGWPVGLKVRVDLPTRRAVLTSKPGRIEP